MSSLFISYTDLEQMANLIRQNVTAFDSVEYVSGLGILIKGADGKTYCRIASDIWTYFYQDGTDDPSSATPTLTANAYFAYLGITENGIVGCNSSGGAKWLLTKSYHDEYAFLYESGTNEVKAISQTSDSSNAYTIGGGNSDSQTNLCYFPVRPGTHATDCTPNAFYSHTYQNDSFYGLVSYDGKPYIQVKRWFLKGVQTTA